MRVFVFALDVGEQFLCFYRDGSGVPGGGNGGEGIMDDGEGGEGSGDLTVK